MSTETSKSTPPPWKFWRDMDPKQPLEIHGQSADPICQIAMENTQALANADLIIRAVNSHAKLVAERDALLAACKRGLPWIGRLIANNGHLESVAPNDAIGAMDQMQAALSLAQGGEK